MQSLAKVKINLILSEYILFHNGKLTIHKKVYRRLQFMTDQKNNSVHDIAKKMIIDGETFDTIMEKLI